MQAEMIAANGQQLFTRLAGDPGQPLILFLHGFPEYGGAWDDILPVFSDAYRVAAPDQRGYGWSSKPAAVDDYRAHHLAADMHALADQLSPGRPFDLVAHDWGASIAYLMAFLKPDRIRRLVVCNGVHPLPFQSAVIEDPEQRKASQYIRWLRRPDSHTLIAENGYARAFDMLSRTPNSAWLIPEKRARYLAAWSQPGAMNGMVNWYRASPIVVPKPDERFDAAQLPNIPASHVRVRMPHLVVWGMDDIALRPSTRAGLDEHCDALVVKEVQGADHWIIHQKPELVIGHIKGFLAA
jgi:pimeloyl-ACP methyl ester carboxylesterase